MVPATPVRVAPLTSARGDTSKRPLLISPASPRQGTVNLERPLSPIARRPASQADGPTAPGDRSFLDRPFTDPSLPQV